MLKCLSKIEAIIVITKVHEGISSWSQNEMGVDLTRIVLDENDKGLYDLHKRLPKVPKV